MRLAAAVFLAAGLILAGLCVFGCAGKPAAEPGTVVKQFLTATIQTCNSGDFGKMKPYVCKRMIDWVASKPDGERQFVLGMQHSMTTSGRDLSRVDQINIVETRYEHDTAYVKVEPIDKTAAGWGPNARLEFVLVREDGVWKVDPMATSSQTRR